jgi:hypothetical protein
VVEQRTWVEGHSQSEMESSSQVEESWEPKLSETWSHLMLVA